MDNNFIDYYGINAVLDHAQSSFNEDLFWDVIKKIDNHHHLSDYDTSILLKSPNKFNELIFEKAKNLNEYLYNKKMNFYGVVYVSDFCIETCSYCGDNIYSDREEQKGFKHFLSDDDLKKDIKALLMKNPKIPEICILSGDSPKLEVNRWIRYLESAFSVYTGKIILNTEPFSYFDFLKIRNHFPTKTLQFRVFQESYDPIVYDNEHKYYTEIEQITQKSRDFLHKQKIMTPPKKNFNFRLFSQERAILAGFNEYGLGVLFGLNNMEHKSQFEIIALKKHSEILYDKYGMYPSTISFPRILPSKGVNFKTKYSVDDAEFIKLISITRLCIPYAKLIITCRETPEFRNKIRPVINIEDYEARPGPGGNCATNVIFQMEIADRRTGDEVRNDIISQGFEID